MHQIESNLLHVRMRLCDKYQYEDPYTRSGNQILEMLQMNFSMCSCHCSNWNSFKPISDAHSHRIQKIHSSQNYAPIILSY